MDVYNGQRRRLAYRACDGCTKSAWNCKCMTRSGIHEIPYAHAQDVHAGLLFIGAKPGTPVSYDPQYKPATGQIVDVYVLWKDAEGNKHQARAQEWIKDTKTAKAMSYDWVFAGSGFWKDEETGQEHYRANAGDLVCVSNFPTATLDLPVQSTDSNDDLQFVPFTEHVPPRGTKVRVVLIPRLAQGKAK